ncbi:MAG TPA: polysaccharide biosynthesis/export family protein [bacterium]|nr:polysaccharide biosynthesis/export family protein [bacterium]HPG82741.1 polysaccharide biosynthesis/export family protein [bacterium]
MKHKMYGCIISLGLFLMLAYDAGAQEYMIGKDDVLEISFWQDKDLNVTTRVDANGQISLPIGGIIKADSLTIEQLADKIVERISLYNRRITNVSIKVTEYGSRKVYVMGHVKDPKKYTFEIIPNLWDIISEAGGPLETADLNNVLIIRKSADGDPRTMSVDVSEVLRNREFQRLPKIEPGDNIYVSAIVGAAASTGIQAMQTQPNVLFIYGEVGNSGVFTFNKELNLLEALITAGGPTSTAKLSEVRVIRKNGAYSSVTKVNVKKYADESSPSFFLVKGGDTIYVPRKSVFRESVFWDIIMIFSGAALTSLAYSLVTAED